MSEGQRRRLRLPLSVRTHMLGLILATLVPMLAFSAFLAIRAAEHEQALLAATVQDRTRAAARDLEQELTSLRALLFAVANTGNVSPGECRAPVRGVLPPSWGRVAWPWCSAHLTAGRCSIPASRSERTSLPILTWRRSAKSPPAACPPYPPTLRFDGATSRSR